MSTLLIVGAAFVGGYAASVFTWDRVHTVLIGAKAKAAQFRAQAAALEAKIRSAL